MSDPKDRPDEEKKDVVISSDEELVDDTASELFFGKHLKDLVDDDLKVDDESAKRTPMDSPSVQFFGESLEEFVKHSGADEASGGDDEEPEADDDEAPEADDDEESDPDS